MQASSDPHCERDTLKTDAYKTKIEKREFLRDGNPLWTSVSEVTIRGGMLDDSYPEWHPALDSFLMANFCSCSWQRLVVTVMTVLST